MLQALEKPGVFLLIICLGYILKRVGLFEKTDYKILTKIVLNITLPAAVIVSFSSYQPDSALLFCVLLGLGFTSLALGLAMGISRKFSASSRAIWYNSSPGYNIGAFTLPFVQSFLPPVGVVATCLFDIGNSIMCNGGAYALTAGMLNGEKMRFSKILRRLVSSVPFDTYMLMLVLTLCGVQVPQGVAQFIQPIAGANPFVAMLMVGLMFDVSGDKTMLRNVGGVLLLKYCLATAGALLCYFVLPLPLEVRQTLCICVFAPASVSCTAFSEKAGGSSAEAGCINSLSIVISICCILSLLAMFGSL